MKTKKLDQPIFDTFPPKTNDKKILKIARYDMRHIKYWSSMRIYSAKRFRLTLT